jgi:lipoic acid synthetase
MKENHVKKPDWLKVNAFSGENYNNVVGILNACHVNTVCNEALCPNRGKCFNENTATFIILGKVCSRHCRFCNVTSGEPACIDENERRGIAQAVAELGLKYVVITSVTRDDLPDGGSGHFAQTIYEIKKLNPDTHVEALIPDFMGDMEAVRRVLDSPCTVVGHNVETVPSLYAAVRPEADYGQSLKVIAEIKRYKPDIISKSGMMVGLGETKDEVLETIRDLREAGCEILTIGQYLRPSKAHYPVAEYIHPDVFREYAETGAEMGFLHVESSPLTRSSFMAHKSYAKAMDAK